MAKNLTMEELIKTIDSLPYNKFKEIVDHYSQNNKTNFEDELDIIVTASLQQKLLKLGINSVCPYCNSDKIIKKGKRKHIQVLYCKECNKKFTPFTNTILEKTRWHWDIWVKVLEMTINNYPIQSMLNVLVDDYGCTGINYKTVWLWRMKFIHALASLPQPILTGVIQVDETFIRESQKGSRELVSYLDKNETRKPRYGRRPSKYGVMGPEFATVVTAVDNRGYCVCKVAALGKLTKELFVDLFEKHLDKPAYICSDANDVYDNYCRLFNIPHYERPSNYVTIIEKNGYETPDWSNPAQAQVTEEKNNKILEKLYNADMIDKITNRDYMKYKEFLELKNLNSLSLARVNELHSDIKKFIYGDMANVSTKYLQDYIGYFSYIRNWRVKNGRYPNSQKDTESIFIEILKAKINYTITDVEEKELELPQPSKRYITILKEETEKARKATANMYFKFGEEDGVKTFNTREYLLDQPKTKLYAIAKECKVRHYKQLALWSLVSEIMKQPDIREIIYKLLQNDRHYKIDDEDLEAIKAGKYIS